MKITRVNKAGVRQTIGPEREVKKDAVSRSAADQVLLSSAAVRRLEARPAGGAALSSLTPERKTQARCRNIAARIRAGDHVPPEDRKYLEQYDAVGYQLAMATRHVKERPRHWDSVVRDAHKPSADGVAAVLAPQSHSSGGDPRRGRGTPSREEEEA